MNPSIPTTCRRYAAAITAALSVVLGVVVRIAARGAAAVVMLVAVTAVVFGVKCKGLLRRLTEPTETA